MTRHFSRRLAPVLIAGLASPALGIAWAQGVVPLELFSVSLDHPAAGPSGAYISGNATDVVLGQLSDDVVPDAAVLHGSQIQFAYAADRRNSWLTLAGAYTAIALLPEAQANGNDGLLALDSAGLVLLTWGGSGTLGPKAVSGSSAWIGASELQVVDRADGTLEVIALAAGGGSILRADWDNPTASITPSASIPVSPGTTALTTYAIAGDTAPLYAAAGGYGLETFSADGTSRFAVNEVGSDPILVPITDTGGNDELAWIRAPAGTSDTLTVLDVSGAPQAPIWFIGGDVAHAVMANVVGSSAQELVAIGNGYSFAISLRRNTEGGQTFHGFAGPVVPYITDLDRAQSAVAGFSHPAVAPGSGAYGPSLIAPALAATDLDGDGDDDLFVAGHPGDSNRAMVHFGQSAREEDLSVFDERTRAWIPEYSYLFNAAGDFGDLAFELPTKPTKGESPAVEATHVQIVVWTQAPGALMNPTPLSILRVALDATTVPGVRVPSVSSIENVHLEFSYLVMNGGEVTSALPAYHETLTLSDFTVAGTPEVFYDLTAGAQLEDPGGTGGSTQRPPISPPHTGGGVIVTP